MRIADLARGSATTLSPEDTLLDAAREMEDAPAAIAVCDGGTLVGIVTARDLVRAAAENASFERTAIEEYMTAAPVTLPASAEPEEGLRLMLEGGFRHIPVIDDEDDIVGILTLRDIAAALLRDGAIRQKDGATT